MKKVKELPEFGRPREKLRAKGARALSDAELLAVILGSGHQGRDVMAIASKAARLVSKNKGRVSLEMMTRVDGIGPVKASQIVAGFELARRYMIKESIKIDGPETALPLLSFIADKKQEYFVCISLNGANEVIETRVVTIGLLDKSQVHPREVFADVLMDRAAAVILAHNHPSGELTPSQVDLKIHHRLTEAGRILGIKVLDHMIVTKEGYYSFQKEDAMI